MEKQAIQSRLWSVVRHVPVILMAAILAVIWTLQDPAVSEFMSYTSVLQEEITLVTIAYGAAYAVYRFGDGRFSGRTWKVVRPLGAILAVGMAFNLFLVLLDYLSGNTGVWGQVFTLDSLGFFVLMGTLYYEQLWIARHVTGLVVPERVYQTPW